MYCLKAQTSLCNYFTYLHLHLLYVANIPVKICQVWQNVWACTWAVSSEKQHFFLTHSLPRSAHPSYCTLTISSVCMTLVMHSTGINWHVSNEVLMQSWCVALKIQDIFSSAVLILNKCDHLFINVSPPPTLWNCYTKPTMVWPFFIY